MKAVVLAGGYGGARFAAGLRDHLSTSDSAEITVIANTADDLWLHGLKICPDLDTLMYTLGGGISAERGWGRDAETFTVKSELDAYHFGPDWFGLGDRDLATHLIRSQLLTSGYPLSSVTQALCQRWQPGVTLLPMSDERVETHVVVAVEDEPADHQGPDGGGEPVPGSEREKQRRAIHFQEWWIRHRAALPAEDFVLVGVEGANPAPGVLEAIEAADVILIAPSNPVVSIGPILAVAGVTEAIQSARAPVVGLSGIIGGAPLRGMADACLQAIGVESSAAGVGLHYGARKDGGLLDAWFIDDQDAEDAPSIEAAGITVGIGPTIMDDAASSVAVAAAVLGLAAI